MDSTGLHAFVKARERAEDNGHAFLLIGLQSGPRRLLELTGTEFLADDAYAVELLERFTSGGSSDGSVRRKGESFDVQLA